MIKRTNKLLVTFPTTTAAMAMEHLCRSTGAPGRLIPLPGEISADCGLAWCAEPEAEALLISLMDTNALAYQGIHRCLV